MNTPIFDYVNEYINEKTSRFHMPGHKGVPGFLGVEPRDLTEIDGADELYLSDGIILESEANAGSLFNANTFYSTEGSSHTIKAAMALIVKWNLINNTGQKTLILAGRNAHKTLVNAAITLDLDIDWIMPKVTDSYESCNISGSELDDIMAAYCKEGKALPCALYITSPDYLGNILDIENIATVCHKYNMILCVDNAHGAYLKFLGKSLHPIDLGADICCDSAHKTLPVLTGGAYLHIGNKSESLPEIVNEARDFFKFNAKNALALYGSTSPSYLILQSLDLANIYMDTLGQTLIGVEAFVNKIKARLSLTGYTFIGDEPLKMTLLLPGSGKKIAKLLYVNKIIPEYYDDNHIVFMVSSQNTINDMNRLVEFLESSDILSLAKEKNTVFETSYEETERIKLPKRALTPKEAFFSPSEKVLIKDSIGRIISEALLSCPPAVPLFISGEIIDERILNNRKWLNDDTISVVK